MSIYNRKPVKKERDPNLPPRPNLMSHDKTIREMNELLDRYQRSMNEMHTEIDSLKNKLRNLTTRLDSITSYLKKHM